MWNIEPETELGMEADAEQITKVMQKSQEDWAEIQEQRKAT